MSDFNIGDMINAAGLLIILQCLALTVFLVVRKRLTASRFKRFLAILVISLSCAVFPFGFLGLICGSPAMVLASLLISIFLDKDEPRSKK